MIGIKDFEMPKSCYDCKLKQGDSIGDSWCPFIDDNLYNLNGDMMTVKRDKNCPLVEAIPKADYEARFKADMVAMLTDIQLEIKELWDGRYDVWLDNQYYIGKSDTLEEVIEVIQQKIDALKGIKNGNVD